MVEIHTNKYSLIADCLTNF